MAVYSIRFLGIGETRLSIERPAERATDLRVVWSIIGEKITHIVREQFETEGARGSTGGWSPLSTSTLEKKRRLGQSSRILIATGALWDAAATEGGGRIVRFAHYMRWTLTGRELAVARRHQTGTSKMPARPILDLTERDEMEFTRDIQAYVMEGLVARVGF